MDQKQTWKEMKEFEYFWPTGEKKKNVRPNLIFIDFCCCPADSSGWLMMLLFMGEAADLFFFHFFCLFSLWRPRLSCKLMAGHWPSRRVFLYVCVFQYVLFFFFSYSFGYTKDISRPCFFKLIRHGRHLEFFYLFFLYILLLLRTDRGGGAL